MKFLLSLTTCLSLIAMAGCQSSSESASSTTPVHASGEHVHDHSSDHPETLSEAATQIAAMSKTILAAFAAGTPTAAHEQLHEIGHLIEELPKCAANSEISDEAKRSVAEATDKLMNAFGALDESMHGGETKSLDDVEFEVDWSLKTLAAIVKQTK